MPDWSALAAALRAATGPDAALDAAIARTFAQPAADFTESVDACRRLAAVALPGWRLHVGFGGSGVVPYVSASRGEARVDAEAPTVPLAILRVLVAALAGSSPSPSG
jgi:hypothetical protein